MIHRASPRYWRCYRELPEDVRRVADECYVLLCADPRHPSLRFKKAGRFWSVRAGLHHRALAVQHEDELVWFWIGTHAAYDRLIGA